MIIIKIMNKFANSEILISTLALTSTLVASAAFVPVLLVINRSTSERRLEQLIFTCFGVIAFSAYRVTEILSLPELFLEHKSLHKISNIFLLL